MDAKRFGIRKCYEANECLLFFLPRQIGAAPKVSSHHMRRDTKGREKFARLWQQHRKQNVKAVPLSHFLQHVPGILHLCSAPWASKNPQTCDVACQSVGSADSIWLTTPAAMPWCRRDTSARCRSSDRLDQTNAVTIEVIDVADGRGMRGGAGLSDWYQICHGPSGGSRCRVCKAFDKRIRDNPEWYAVTRK